MTAEWNANLAARLIEQAAKHPDRTAIVEYRKNRRRVIRYGELAAKVAELAGRLTARGLAPGDAALVFVPVSIELYAILLAILHRGATAVFVDAWANRERLETAIETCRPRAFVAVPSGHLLRLASRAVRAIPIAVVIRRESLSAPGRGNDRAPERLEPSAVAIVSFTTGSTGCPKAAARTHGLLQAQHEALAGYFDPRDGDVDMPLLPMFVLQDLGSGIPCVLPDIDPRRPTRFDPASVVHAMQMERVTTSVGSPAAFERLARWAGDRGMRLPLRRLYTGGAPVLPGLARLLADAVEGETRIVYGATEAEPIAGIEARLLLAAQSDPSRQGLCVGAPIAPIETRIVRATDEAIALDASGLGSWEVPTGEAGELLVAGPHVLPSYFHDPEADRRSKIADGGRLWHRTGDAVRRDDEGRLWLLGRVAHRVRREGVVWWPLPAELRAAEVEGVRHAAYVGRPDPARGQRAVLCVETEASRQAGTNLLARLPGNNLLARLRAALAPMPVDEVRVLPRIPRDPRHESKTDMQRLIRMLEELEPIS